jgi:hypothetical protein
MMEVEDQMSNVEGQRSEQDIIIRPDQPPVLHTESVADYMPKLMELSMSPRFNKEAFETLTAFAHEEIARQQQERFEKAFSAFQGECPPIEPDTQAQYDRKIVRRDGSREVVRGATASINRIMDTLTPVASKFGIGLNWPIATAAEKSVTVVASASGFGHTRSSAPLDWPLVPIVGNVSGKANSVHDQINASMTFARKATMLALTGARIAGEDYEAMSRAGDGPPAPRITDDQCNELNDLIIAQVEALNKLRKEKGKTTITVEFYRKKLHGTYKVEADAELTVPQFEDAKNRMRAE